jgi:hypothetical protein
VGDVAVNDVRITPNLGDIVKEQEARLNASEEWVSTTIRFDNTYTSSIKATVWVSTTVAKSVWEVNAVLDAGVWVYNTSFRGDMITSLDFRIMNDGGFGVLEYLSPVQIDIRVRATTSAPYGISPEENLQLVTNLARNFLPDSLIYANSSETFTYSEGLTYSDDTLNATKVCTGSMVVGGDVTIGGHLMPSVTNTFNIGSDDLRWNTVYVSANTIDLGGAQISAQEGGSISLGDAGITLTDINASGTSHTLGSVFISGSGLSTGSLRVMSASTGTLAAGIVTGGSVSVSGTVSAGSARFAGDVLLSGATRNIGTSTAHDLRLVTNNTDRIAVTNAGNVGIGTATPATTFHVKLTNQTNGPLWENVQSSGDAKSYLSQCPSNVTSIIGPNAWTYQGQTGGQLRFQVRTGANIYYNYTFEGSGTNYFTGQHMCHSDFLEQTKESLEDKIGYIVVSTGEYKILDKQNKQAITINDALPKIKLSNHAYQKNVFGIITNEINERPYRKEEDGSIILDYEEYDYERNIHGRIRVNSVGEGAIWVCNENGSLENGDYITSSNVPGLGMKQADDILHNFTVAKITCDLDFSDLSLESKFDIRYLLPDGSIIDKTTYDARISAGQDAYIAAFVGCTYHCG